MHIEQELIGLRAEVARLTAKLEPMASLIESRLEPRLPLLVTKKRAAYELSISPRKLSDLIRTRAIVTVETGKTRMIPREELLKVATPKVAAPSPRKPRSPPRVAAKSHGDKIRALLKR